MTWVAASTKGAHAAISSGPRSSAFVSDRFIESWNKWAALLGWKLQVSTILEHCARGVVMSPLIRLSLRLGSVVILAVILLFSVGIWAATQLQQDLLPNISLPSFLALTADPGASPGFA